MTRNECSEIVYDIAIREDHQRKGVGRHLIYRVLLPQYFLESKISRDFPPPITHVEYFYGFLGVAVAWQLAFLVVSRDPVRYRAMMIPGIVEKASFGLAAVTLYALDRLSTQMLAAGVLDLTLGALFVVSYVRTGSRAHGSRRP